MLDYECNDGVWTPRELVDWKLMTPVDDGTEQPILSLSPGESKKALGVKDCPAGRSTDQLKAIEDKMEQWVLIMKHGHLPASWVWVAYTFQLWPSIRYGIGTMTNGLDEAEDFLGEHDNSLLNIFGIARTVKVGWRRIHSTFGGFVIYNFATE